MSFGKAEVRELKVGISPPTPAPLPSRKPPRLEKLNRQTLLTYFTNSWDLNEWLFSSITGEGALYQNPDPLRHPLIFYWGHTAAFYVNKLILAGVRKKGIDPWFEVLFEMGVDPSCPEELVVRNDWPTIEAVASYRRKVFELVAQTIEKVEIRDVITADDPLWALMMGLEHDRIHFETSSVLIRQYPVQNVTRPQGWVYAPRHHNSPDEEMIAVAPGQVVLGKPAAYPTFGWDNEYGRLKLDVEAFEAARDLVTNVMFLDFVENGGYSDRRFWSHAGWHWKTSTNSRYPRFWVPNPRGFKYRAMFDIFDLPSAWPVEVNGYEADAYCRWRGSEFRLLSEGEFHRIGAGLGEPGKDLGLSDRFNMNMKFGSPCPVGLLDSATTAEGFRDVRGNVWTWLKDDFQPLPGFKAHSLYTDFSEPFFDSNHATLLGGSWATTGTGCSQYYRLWFRKFFYQHAGFRLARNGR